jgi:hypothetical protein
VRKSSCMLVNSAARASCRNESARAIRRDVPTAGSRSRIQRRRR